MSLNPITIRNLGPEDAHLLDRVREGVFEDQLDPARAWAFLATRVNEMVVALDRGEVVGFIAGTVVMHADRPTQFAISQVSVHPDLRCTGIGTRLLRRACELAADRGCESIIATIDAGNSGARAFFARYSEGVQSVRVSFSSFDIGS